MIPQAALGLVNASVDDAARKAKQDLCESVRRQLATMYRPPAGRRMAMVEPLPWKPQQFFKSPYHARALVHVRPVPMRYIHQVLLGQQNPGLNSFAVRSPVDFLSKVVPQQHF